MCVIAVRLANSADPDQTAPKKQSDQGPHCLVIICVHCFRSVR